MHNSVYTHFFVICYCNYLVWHSLLLIYKTIISLWIIKITLINNRCQKSGMTEMYGLVPKQQTHHKEKDKTWRKKERNEWGQCRPPEPHHTIRIKNTTAEMRETTYHSSWSGTPKFGSVQTIEEAADGATCQETKAVRKLMIMIYKTVRNLIISKLNQ